ncbi:MAG: EpsG family protein [Candidatus Fimenecus sp.]
MNIYVLNILLTFLWAFVFLGLVKSDNGKKAFCALTGVQWILISGLRGMSVSSDMLSYKTRFENTMNTPWNNLFDNFYLVYVDEEGKDPGYAVFEKFIQLFTKDYHAFLFIVAVLFFTGFAVWVYKNSTNPLLSMLIFDSFLWSFFALTGTRQTLATLLVVFIGGYYIKERKFWPFLLVSLIAFTVHKSAICFFPFYFISQINITKKYLAGVLCSLPILFVFRNQCFMILGSLVGYEYSEFENSGAYSFTFMYIAVLLVSIILLNRIKINCPDYKMYYNALFMGAVLLPLVFVNPAAMRTVQYYSLYLILFIPHIIPCFERRLRVPLETAMIVLLLMMTNLYSRSYEFFWQ